jgi:hypothetical protein
LPDAMCDGVDRRIVEPVGQVPDLPTTSYAYLFLQ